MVVKEFSSPSLFMPTIEAPSSKARKDDEREAQLNDIPSSVLSTVLFP